MSYKSKHQCESFVFSASAYMLILPLTIKDSQTLSAYPIYLDAWLEALQPAGK